MECGQGQRERLERAPRPLLSSAAHPASCLRQARARCWDIMSGVDGSTALNNGSRSSLTMSLSADQPKVSVVRQHSRADSTASDMSTTEDFYRVSPQRRTSADRRQTPSSSFNAEASTSNNRAGASSSALPAQSRGTTHLPSIRSPVSPSSSDYVAAWRVSNGPTSPSLEQHHRRLGNGPIITRISAADDAAASSSAGQAARPKSPSAQIALSPSFAGDAHSRRDVLNTRRHSALFEGEGKDGAAIRDNASQRQRSGATLMARSASEETPTSSDLTRHATLASFRRSSLDLDELTASSIGHGMQDSSGNSTFGMTAQSWQVDVSRENLVDETRARAATPTFEALTQQTRAAANDGAYRNHATSSQTRGQSVNASKPLPSPPYAVTIPLERITSPSGRPIRNYQRHPGSNHFFLSGRILSSKDNHVPFILSLGLAILMPILFFAFSGPFMWDNLGGGGKASIFIFLYLCLVMWTSMVSLARPDVLL